MTYRERFVELLLKLIWPVRSIWPVRWRLSFDLAGCFYNVSKQKMERGDLELLGVPHIYVRVRNRHYATIEGWRLIRPTLVINHLALQNEYVGKGYGGSLATGLARIARKERVERVIFTEHHLTDDHIGFFESLGAKQLTSVKKDELVASDVWSWNVPADADADAEVDSLNLTQKAFVRALQAIRADKDGAAIFENAKTRLIMSSDTLRAVKGVELKDEVAALNRAADYLSILDGR